MPNYNLIAGLAGLGQGLAQSKQLKEEKERWKAEKEARDNEFLWRQEQAKAQAGDVLSQQNMKYYETAMMAADPNTYNMAAAAYKATQKRLADEYGIKSPELPVYREKPMNTIKNIGAIAEMEISPEAKSYIYGRAFPQAQQGQTMPGTMGMPAQQPTQPESAWMGRYNSPLRFRPSTPSEQTPPPMQPIPTPQAQPLAQAAPVSDKSPEDIFRTPDAWRNEKSMSYTPSAMNNLYNQFRQAVKTGIPPQGSQPYKALVKRIYNAEGNTGEPPEGWMPKEIDPMSPYEKSTLGIRQAYLDFARDKHKWEKDVDLYRSYKDRADYEAKQLDRELDMYKFQATQQGLDERAKNANILSLSRILLDLTDLKTDQFRMWDSNPEGLKEIDGLINKTQNALSTTMGGGTGGNPPPFSLSTGGVELVPLPSMKGIPVPQISGGGFPALTGQGAIPGIAPNIVRTPQPQVDAESNKKAYQAKINKTIESIASELPKKAANRELARNVAPEMRKRLAQAYGTHSEDKKVISTVNSLMKKHYYPNWREKLSEKQSRRAVMEAVKKYGLDAQLKDEQKKKTSWFDMYEKLRKLGYIK